MGIQYVQPKTTAEAEHLYLAGLLYTNMDDTIDRTEPKWDLARPDHMHYADRIDNPKHAKYCGWRPEDFAYLVEE